VKDNKRVIKIHRRLTTQEINFIINNSKQDFDIEHTPGVVLPGALAKYNPVESDLPEDQKREINYFCLDKLRSFGDENVQGRSVSEHLQFERLNIWYYSKFRIYFEYRNKAFLRRQVEIAFQKYDQVILFSEPNELIVNTSGLEWYPAKSTKSNFSSIVFLKYLIVVTRRLLSSIFQPIQNSIPNVILTCPNRNQPYLSIKTLTKQNDDFVIGYLLEEHANKFICIDEFQIPKFNKGSRLAHYVAHKSRKTIFGESIICRGVLSPRLWLKVSGHQEKLNRNLLQIKNHLPHPDYQFFIDRLRHLKMSHQYFFARYESYKRFFKSHKFRNVVSVDENSQFYKSVLDAAKQTDLRTIGIQHGNIYDLHVAYMFTKHDIANDPHVDRTLVWGQYWKDVLIEKGNYLEKRIGITGQPRTDIVPKLKSNGSISNFLILFASQPQRDPNLRLRAATDVMTAAHKLENSQIVIKLHPRETDHQYFHDLAKSVGLINYKLSYADDLYEMINESSVVVTCFSTVAGEAVYFNKPIVILDHLQQDLMGYHKIGIASQAIDSGTLNATLQKIQNGELTVNETAYREYIEKYAYRIDGNVCERIMKEIEGNQQTL